MRLAITISVALLLSIGLNAVWAFAHVGPTKRGDTLWQIANQSRPSKQISVTAMIKAIKQLNPDAFVGGNHNILNTGITLQVPATLQEFNAVVGKATPEQAVLSQETGRELGVLSQYHQAQLRQVAEQAASLRYVQVQQKVQQLHQQLHQANNRILYLQQLQQQTVAEQSSTTYWGWFWFGVWPLTIGLFLSRHWCRAHLARIKLSLPQVDLNFKMSKYNISALKDKFTRWQNRSMVAQPSHELGQQAELDVGEVPPITGQAAMPLTEPTVTTETLNIEPYQVSILDDPEEKRLLTALQEAPQDVHCHMALLAHYVELESQHAFDEHVKSMIDHGVMEEGDTLWDRVRKLYLNTWVYDLA